VGLGDLEPEMREGGPVWSVYLKIAVFELSISGTRGKPPANDG